MIAGAEKVLQSKYAKIIPWILWIVFMAGGIYGVQTYQTKKDAADYEKMAETIFVKKEVQEIKDQKADERWQEIIKRLDRIEKKQDEFIYATRRK